MTDGPLQPDEPAFPQTEDALGLLASAALPAETRARHLHAIRLRAAELGAAPAGAPREARALPKSLTESSVRGLSGLRWRGRRAAAIAGVWLGSLSLGTGVAAAASMDDLPGEPLYGLKRAVEAVQLRLPGDVQDDVRRRLELAERRLDEAEALRARGAADDLLVRALDDADGLLTEAGTLAGDDAELTAAVAGSAGRARTRLAELLDGGLPDQAAERAREAIETATERADERNGDGRGPDGDRGSAPATTPPTGRADADDEDENDDDGDSAPGRGRGRGGEAAGGAATPGAPSPPTAGGGGSPPEARDDEDGAPSERGRSSHAPATPRAQETDDGEDEDDTDDDGPGSGQGQSGAQSAGPPDAAGQGWGQGSGQGSGNAGGNSGNAGGGSAASNRGEDEPDA